MKLAEALARLTKNLEAQGARFALVGGLAASVTPQRPQDLADIHSILRENPALDVAIVLRLLSLIEQRGYACGQSLLAKWRRLQSEHEAE